MKQDKARIFLYIHIEVTRVGIVLLTHRTETKKKTKNDQHDYLNKAVLGYIQRCIWGKGAPH